MGKLKKMFLIIASFAAVFAFAIIGVNSVPTSVVNIGGTLNYSSNFIFTIIDSNTVSVKARVNTISGDIEIPSQVTISNHQYSVVTIDEEGFKNCSNITQLKVPSTITSIGSSAFDGCSNMTDVTIDSSYVYNNLTSKTALGNLVENADTINLKTSADNGTNSFLNDNYIKSQTISGYNTYSFAYLITIPTGEGYELQNTNNTTFTTTKVRPGESISFKVAIQTGYTQSTPVVKSNGTVLTATSGVYTISNIQANQVLTVEGVEINKYTITFAVNNNTYGSTSRATQAEVPYGSTISVNGNTVTINGVTTTATPTAITGYTTAFSSWTNATGTITDARTITANFTKTAYTYTVQYNTWNGTAVATSSHTYDTAKNLTTYAALNSANANAFVVTGYTFAGWATTAHNTTKTGTVVHTDGKSVTNLTAVDGATVNLYATYTANEISLANQSYTLTYSTSSQTQVITGATNGTDSYTYAITAGNTSSYFSISGTTITVAAGAQAGTYPLTVQATDDETAKTASATITITINKAAATISFAESSVEKTTSDADFTNTLTNTGDGTVTYSSSATGVVTVNSSTGLVHIVGDGTAIITATVTDGTNYTYATKTVTYTVNVLSALIFTGNNAFTLQIGDGTVAGGWNGTLEYKVNDGSWTTWTKATPETISVSSSPYKLYMRGTGNTVITGNTDEKYFYISGSATSVDCSGNIMTLLNYTDPDSATMGNYCFRALFYACTSLTSAPALPDTTLASYCYYGMFAGCTSLATAPTLPATTLAEGCYGMMFAGCTSLATAPALSATTLAQSCYGYMFAGCTSLATAPALPATTLANSCYAMMFYGCTSLTTAPALPATTLAEGCYGYMFYQCTGLIIASALPATTLATQCYMNMFYGCTSLTTAPIISATILAENCCNSMFQGCTSLTTAPVLSATTLATQCYYHMFDGCTSLTTAPVLPATTLAESCYSSMFKGCTALTTAPVLSATTLAESCYRGMFQGCTSLTSAPALPATTITEYCYTEMFKGCTSLTMAPTLPATTMETWCYREMFSGCTNLRIVELDTELSDMTLCLYRDDTYDPYFTNMFANCNSGGFTGTPANNKYYYIDEPFITFTGNNAFTFKIGDGTVAGGWDGTLEYKVNSGDWTTLNKSASGTISVSSSPYKLYLRGTGNTVITGNSTTNYFKIAGSATSVACSGNIMNLLNYSNPGSATMGDYCFNRLFYACTSLTSAPALPAATLAEGCYRGMFYGCTSLTTAPALPATTLKLVCYWEMFRGCTSLTTAPTLPATTLAQQCYSGMFWGCTSLTTAPSLPATTLAKLCYQAMFSSCTSLTTAPALPATTLADGCYIGMFSSCTSLTTAPTLPATTLATECYSKMFYGCTSLTTAPALPATTLASYCCYQMFYGCTSLTTAPTLPATTLASSCYKEMFRGCSNIKIIESETEISGYTLYLHSSNINSYSTDMFTGCYSGSGYFTGTPQNDYYYYIDEPFITFTGNNAFTLQIGDGTVAGGWDGTLEYKVNDGSWTTWTQSAPETISVSSAPYKLCMRGTGNTIITGSSGSSKYFNIAGSATSVACSGNIMGLLDYTDLDSATMGSYCFYGLFYNCIKLTSAPILPATTLETYCYRTMFRGCTSLTTAPALPATTSANYCYYQMFYDCSNLTTAPTLSATTLANYCYGGMFKGCTSLTTAPALPATTLANYCYTNMFNGCTSLTTAPTLSATKLKTNCYYGMFEGCTSLTSAPALPATTLANDCYSYMFSGCTSLTTAPTLSATTLKNDCYMSMFKDCTSLTSAPALPATTLTDYCYMRMFNGCTSLTTAPTLSATTLAVQCCSFMFANCTSLTTAPTLSATTLAQACYYGMFEGCTSLVSAPALPAITLAQSCYSGMFKGCTALTTAPSLPATTLAEKCYYQMFEGCTSLVSASELSATTLATQCYYRMFYGCSSLKVIQSDTELTGYSLCLYRNNETSDYFTYMFTGCYSGSGYFRGTPANNKYYYIDTPFITFTGNDGGFTFSIGNGSVAGGWNGTLEYKVNSGDWTTLNKSSSGTIIVSSSPYKLYMRGTGNNVITGSSGSSKYFNINGPATSVSCLGDIRNLLNYSNPSSTTMSNYCFAYLFYNRTQLTSAPALPATTLAIRCYYNMFAGCINLTKAPALPATTLTSYCYYGMFAGCTSLATAPALPATTLTPYCYANMFYGCSNLTTAPALSATTLAEGCYNQMFYNCTRLAAAPSLLATTLASSCYAGMFYGCTSLATAPALPATTLADYCYSGMFYGCSNLTTAPTLSATTLANGCYSSMFQGCTRLTTAPALPATTLSNECYSSMFQGCTRLTTAPTLPARTYMYSRCYASMFAQCTSLTTAPTLPSTLIVGEYCYSGMFAGCTSLTAAPALPATTLTDYCYSGMFYECSNLTTAPALPATSLYNAQHCYEDMFYGCTSLTTAPALPATRLSSYCYCRMFAGCENLTSAPALPATSLIGADYCYSEMFRDCTSLTTAPALPATTLGYYCYASMFSNCTSLTAVSALPDVPQDSNYRSCYESMFEYCSSLKIIESSTELTGRTVLLYSTNTYLGYEFARYMFNDCYYGSGYFTGTPQENYYYYLDGPFGGYTISYSNSSIAKSSSDADFTNTLTNTGDGTVTYSSSNTSVATINSSTGLVHIVGLGTTTITATVANSANCAYSQNTATYTLYIIEPSIMFVGNGAFSLQVGLDTGAEEGEYNNPADEGAWDGTLEYKINNGGWTTWNKDNPEIINVNIAPYKLYLRGSGNTVITGIIDDVYYGSILPSFLLYGNATSVDCLGNIMTLLDYQDPDNAVMDDYCFGCLFRGCRILTSAPELPATTLAEGCYKGMFQECTRLTTAPAILPATTLADYCYNGMFYNCTSLATAPALPATTLTEGCYAGMFRGCSNLAIVPALPATTLATYCYASMFSGCSNVCIIDSSTPLDDAGILYLHSNNISAYSYYMFYECRIGYTFQEDYQGTPQDGDYYYLNGNRVIGATISFAEINVSKSLNDADFTNPITNTGDGIVTYTSSDTSVATINSSTGLVHIVGLGTTTITATAANGANCIYATNTATYTLTVEEAAITFTGDGGYRLSIQGGQGRWTNQLEYKINDGSWTVWNKSTPGSLTVDSSPYKLYLRGTGNTVITGNNTNAGCFRIEDRGATSVDCSGNIMTLLDYTDPDNATMGSYCFSYLFSDCSLLTSAPALPATSLATYCYQYMFSGCTSLKTAPALPATTLADYCYQYMFRDCISLTTAPTLSATTYSRYAYQYMFSRCSNLYVIEYTSPQTTQGLILCLYRNGTPSNCFTNMFENCSGFSGTPSNGKYYYILGPTISFIVQNDSRSISDPDSEIPLTNTGDGVVTYSSSNTLVATINSSTGVIHIVGMGTTTITATVNDESYSVNTATCTLTTGISTPTSSTTTYTYNGNEQTYYPANWNEISSYCNISNNTRTNPGSQTVTFSLKDPTNCQWYDGTTSNKTLTFTIRKITLAAPANLAVNPNTGVVTWDSVTGATGYEISFDSGSTWSSATSGTNYNSTITASTGTKNIRVRAVTTDTTYYNASGTARSISVNVYSVTVSSTLGSQIYEYTNGTNGSNVDSVTINLISGHEIQGRVSEYLMYLIVNSTTNYWINCPSVRGKTNSSNRWKVNGTIYAAFSTFTITSNTTIIAGDINAAVTIYATGETATVNINGSNTDISAGSSQLFRINTFDCAGTTFTITMSVSARGSYSTGGGGTGYYFYYLHVNLDSSTGTTIASASGGNSGGATTVTLNWSDIIGHDIWAREYGGRPAGYT